MDANPFAGIGYHWLGGLAAGSFYVPYRRVRQWSWETYWLVVGFFSWILVPWAFALALTRDLPGVLGHALASALAWAWFFGLLGPTGGQSGRFALTRLRAGSNVSGRSGAGQRQGARRKAGSTIASESVVEVFRHAPAASLELSSRTPPKP